MVRDLPQKLSLTRLALSCRTQKELHVRLLRVNPATSFSPQRAYKWAAGAAVPRDGQIYADLAAALDLSQGADFYASMPLADFARVLCLTHPHVRREAEALVGYPLADEPVEGTGPRGMSDLPAMLAGRYACFSPAWAVARAGSIVLGTLDIAIDGAAGSGVYKETIGGNAVTYAGRLYRTSRLLSGFLLSEVTELPIFLCLHLPSPPALGLSGTMAGGAVHDPVTRPCAVRLHAIRYEPSAGVEFGGVGYAAEGAAALPETIADLGFDAAGSRELADLMRASLFAPASDGVTDMSMDTAARFAEVLYRLRAP